MNQKYAVLIAILLSSVSISGCMGEDGSERIDQLEVEKANYQGMMASLNQTLDGLEDELGQLNVSIETLNSRITELDSQILQHTSDISYLN